MNGTKIKDPLACNQSGQQHIFGMVILQCYINSLMDKLKLEFLSMTQIYCIMEYDEFRYFCSQQFINTRTCVYMMHREIFPSIITEEHIKFTAFQSPLFQSFTGI